MIEPLDFRNKHGAAAMEEKIEELIEAVNTIEKDHQHFSGQCLLNTLESKGEPEKVWGNGDQYWYIDSAGGINDDAYQFSFGTCIRRKEFGNCFRTKESAESALAKIKLLLNPLT